MEGQNCTRSRKGPQKTGRGILKCIESEKKDRHIGLGPVYPHDPTIIKGSGLVTRMTLQ
jgi:hypothetical protein